MALSSRHTAAFVARAAGTTVSNTPTASNILDIHRTLDGRVQVHASFTLGLLTNVVLKPQVLGPDSTWRDVTDPGSLTLTASGDKAFLVPCAGCKQFRVLITSSGTVTSSDLSMWFGFQLAGGAIG
jgi:hypothetical protein